MAVFPLDIPSGISEDRYARVSDTMDTPVWVSAIKRVMIAKGYDSQAAFIRAAKERGVMLRPNTLSDALNPVKRSNISTFEVVAEALDVPLGALFQTAKEAAEMAFARQVSAEQHARRAQALKEEILAKLAPMVEAALKIEPLPAAPEPVKPFKVVPRRGRRPV